MKLDDETRALLDWGTEFERDAPLFTPSNHANRPPSDERPGLLGSRTAPGDIDGRSKRNWRRKRLDDSPRLAESASSPSGAP